MAEGRYWLHTLGCAKNEVDSLKLEGLLRAEGYVSAGSPEEADTIVVNTCAFIEQARQESIDTVLSLHDLRRAGSRLVVTGCMAERYGTELAAALPEVDLVAGFGHSFTAPSRLSPLRREPVQLRKRPGLKPDQRPDPGARSRHGANSRRVGSSASLDSFDLLNLPRPASKTPWAYVKVASGCDRRCGFCAIPSFRGVQRSRTRADILSEVRALADNEAMAVREVVLVAQDLASYGRDRSGEPRTEEHGGRAPRGKRTGHAGREPSPLVALVGEVARLVERTRLLYLYPSGLTSELVDAVLATGVPYFDLSLQHVSRPLLARMRRVGSFERFMERIESIRTKAPRATFRSSFILGYPGETEHDHDQLLEFLAAAQLDWAGFFTFSKEAGTYAEALAHQVPHELALERLRECAELQDAITAERRDGLVGRVLPVLVDAPGVARSVHEAPEIDGVVRVPEDLGVGSMVSVRITASLGVDLVAVPEHPGPVASAGAGVRACVGGTR